MSNTDVVVVIPGIMGSTLRRAEDQTPVWGPSVGALLRAVATFGANIIRYTLPDDIGDQDPGDSLEPFGLMPDVHALPGIWTPVKGYDRLVHRLHRLGFREATAERPGNLVHFPYDWRLSNRYTAHRLATIVEPALQRWRERGGPFEDARLIFVCHSMGGLIARWYLEHQGGWSITRTLITLGTPYRGAAKALHQLINGTRVDLGRLAANFTAFTRSMPSLYQLIPEYACIDTGGRLLKTTETTVPELDTRRIGDAMRFHTDLSTAEAARPESLTNTHAIVGTRQPTISTVRLTATGATALNTFGTDNDYGDATVPLTGAVGHNQPLNTNTIVRIADKHGNLHRNPAALDAIEEIITAQPVRRRPSTRHEIRVDAPDSVLAGQPVPVSIDVLDGARHTVRITVTDESGRLVTSRTPTMSGGHAETYFTDLPPGAHTIDVLGADDATPINPVSSITVVWNNA